MRYLIFKFQGAPFQYVKKATHKKTHEHEYRYKSLPSQLPEIDGIGIKENNFNIEKHIQNSRQEILYRHRLPGIAHLFNSTFEIFQLVFSPSFGSQKL